MAILNNPLFLVAASAVISALITAAIETAITNRQKDALERRLEEIRHKHALEVEKLKYENASQLEVWCTPTIGSPLFLVNVGSLVNL